MSIYSNVTEQDLINLRKSAEQHKAQRPLKIKNRVLKQIHDIKLAESLSPITKKLEEVDETTKQLGKIVKTRDVEDGNTQTPAMENITGIQSLLDTLPFMKKSRTSNFFKLEEKPNGRVYWIDVLIKPVRENTIDIIGKEYNITPSMQNYFINTRFTTKSLNINEKETVYEIPKIDGFYNTRHNKGLNSARMKDALHNLPKAIAKNRNPPLPSIENVEDSGYLQGEGVKKTIIPSNIIDIYTRLEIILGLKLSGHTDTLAEGSDLIDELYKRGEIQNEQQYRNALDIFST